MAASNGSTVERSTDLHRCSTDGSIGDHLWCAQRKIFGCTREMYSDSSSGCGFHRPDQVIEGKACQRCASWYRLSERPVPTLSGTEKHRVRAASLVSLWRRDRYHGGGTA